MSTPVASFRVRPDMPAGAGHLVSAAPRRATAPTGRSPRPRRRAPPCTAPHRCRRATVRASSPSQSPRGGRCSDTSRSTLANVAVVQSSSAEMPLAASVITSRCCSGVIGSPSTRVHGPGPRRRRPGGVEAAGREPPVQRPVVGDLVLKKAAVLGAALLRPGGRGVRGGDVRRGAVRRGCASARPTAASAGARRRRKHRLDQLDPPARAGRRSTAPRPGRRAPARRCRRPAGRVCPPSMALARSASRSSRAAGGPACWRPVSQGPMVRAVAT